MYNKNEAAEIRQRFWTSLGQYLLPVPSASGEKVNWINYKTGVKAIRFKMDALSKEAFVAIEIRGDEKMRQRLYQMFLSFKTDFPEAYKWMASGEDDHGKPLSRIYCERTNLTMFNESDWPALISFFKENMLFIDAFWSANKDIFEMAV